MHDVRGRVVPDEGKCIYIKQRISACVTTIILPFQHSKIHPDLKATAHDQLAYIVTDADCDYARLF